MDIRVIVLLLSVGFGGCTSIQRNPVAVPGKQHFKNYALCTCVADGFEAQEVISEAAAAARGYLELGSLPLEAHTEATKLGRQFLKKEYKSKYGAQLIIMKCLDYFHSDELERLYQKYR